MITEDINIDIKLVENTRVSELEEGLLKFGRTFSDHMVVVEYSDGKWHQPSIEPFANLSMNPATSVIHYGQTIFEGMKAFKTDDNDVLVFRPNDNIERLNISAERMCMPAVPPEVFRSCLMTLLDIDRNWVPKGEGNSLYIRPFLFGADEYIGVKPSDTYKFMIFTTPVGNYYNEPVKVKIEREFARSFPGGTGFAKAGGNYAASLYPAKLAQKEGYHQLVWTDALEHKYIEESGTMNIMFVIDGKLITPATGDTILKGITRDSVVTLARQWGMEVEERRVSVDEVVAAQEAGTLTEMFGTGTAATIAQIIEFNCDGTNHRLPEIETRKFSNKVSKHLNDLKRGKETDTNDWIVKV